MRREVGRGLEEELGGGLETLYRAPSARSRGKVKERLAQLKSQMAALPLVTSITEEREEEEGVPGSRNVRMGSEFQVDVLEFSPDTLASQHVSSI